MPPSCANEADWIAVASALLWSVSAYSAAERPRALPCASVIALLVTSFAIAVSSSAGVAGAAFATAVAAAPVRAASAVTS